MKLCVVDICFLYLYKLDVAFALSIDFVMGIWQTGYYVQ